MSEITLREARPEDIAAIAAIERTVFGDPWSARAFQELLREPHVLFLVANAAPRDPSDGTRVLGYIVAWYVVDEAEVANLAVAADARRGGVGARLLDAALAESRARGCHRVFLEVRDSNVAARALYRSRGFEEVGRRPRYYRHPVEDAILMRVEVTAGAS